MSNVVTFKQKRQDVIENSVIVEVWMPTYRTFNDEESALSFARKLCNGVGVKDVRVLEDIGVV